MEDYKKILQIEVYNIVDRLQNGLIHPYTAKQEIFKSTLKAMDYTHSCTELKTFDIHECINEVTKSANKLSPWIVDARKDRSFRYIIKKAIDKMLYSN
tara:strand:- start:1226 stop:1519 length:294 start_codon:yes stop_codon:yes gene_type:complete